MLRLSCFLRGSYLPLSQETIRVIKDTAPVVAPLATKITGDFYPRLFKNNPAAWAFFNKTNQAKGHQSQALADAVIAYAGNIDNLGALGGAVAKINHRHCALGVTPELYQMVHDTLMASIGEVLGEAVTPEIGRGWSNAVMALAEICINAEEDLYKQAEAREGGWRGFKEFELARKERVGQDTVAFDFAPLDSSGPIEYALGQYLSIRLDEARSGVKSPRHYTVTSSPGCPTLQCTTRHVKGSSGNPDGAVSTYMHERLREGDRVRLSAPFGVFTADALFREGDEVAFVTAGIGITPALALSRADRVTVVGALHVDRSEGHTGALAGRVGTGCRTLFGASRSAVLDAVRSFAGGMGGRTQFVVCGPAGFMRESVRALRDGGAENVHVELFGTGSMK